MRVRILLRLPDENPLKALCFNGFQRVLFFVFHPLTVQKWLYIINSMVENVVELLVLHHICVISRQLIGHSILVLNPDFGVAGIKLQCGSTENPILFMGRYPSRVCQSSR